MKIGDVVSLKNDISVSHMFPPKYEDPEERKIKAGSVATVENAYSSGAGIVEFEDGTRILSLDLSKNFELAEGLRFDRTTQRAKRTGADTRALPTKEESHEHCQ